VLSAQIAWLADLRLALSSDNRDNLLALEFSEERVGFMTTHEIMHMTRLLLSVKWDRETGEIPFKWTKKRAKAKVP